MDGKPGSANRGWKVSCAGGVLALVLMSPSLSSQTAPSTAVAPTPPMGWNSWDAYGLTITEDQFRANVNVLATRLKPYGWNYAVIDEGWFLQNPKDRPKPELLKYQIDANGRYIPVPTRFPSAIASGAPDQTASFKPLGDWVHGLGLKFGIHIVRGIPRVAVDANLPVAGSAFRAKDAADTTDACPWDPTNWGVRNTPAGQAWYDSLMSQYAGWGVDLIKVDCISSHPYKIDEIRMIRKAIDKTGRPMVLSLSPGPTAIENAAEVAQVAQMWRISDDIWDLWANPKPWPRTLSSQFATTEAWAQYAKPGNWPDADMLPLGDLRPSPGEGEPRTTLLTPTEQKTMLTLWAMARSPLILGANLTLLDEDTLKLLTNEDLIHIDQASTGSRVVLHSGDMVAWTSDLPDGSIALALFNTGESALIMNSSFEAYNLEGASYKVHDVWTGKNQTKVKAMQGIAIEAHACLLWVLHK